MPLELTRRASADLDDVYEFGLDRWGEEQAELYAAAFWKAASLIEQRPLAWRERQETALPVRVFRFQAHLIIYRVEGKDVTVIRIAHGRSDWINDLA